jgi:hypothetical protein
MIYRYSLKPVEENVKFQTRTINGVSLHINQWSYSDTSLSFDGFEHLVLEERAPTKEGFSQVHHAAPSVTATRVIESIAPVSVPVIEPIIVMPLVKEKKVRMKRHIPSIVIYSEKRLHNHLIARGFSLAELLTYSQAQLYELLLIELEIENSPSLEGALNGE